MDTVHQYPAGVRFFVGGPQTQQPVSDETFPYRVRQPGGLSDGLMKGMLATCRPLTTPQTLTYLHSTVSPRWYELQELASLADIDVQLCDTPFWGGWYPFLGTDPTRPDLGGWHVRTCSVSGYAASSIVGVT
jgi:hypothetical protein